MAEACPGDPRLTLIEFQFVDARHKSLPGLDPGPGTMSLNQPCSRPRRAMRWRS